MKTAFAKFIFSKTLKIERILQKIKENLNKTF